MSIEQPHISPPAYRLSDFFDAHWADFLSQTDKKVEPHWFKAVNSLRVCQSEVLGKRIYVCPDCGDISEVGHSCKHRFCPRCSWKDTVKWAEKVHGRLLDIPHRHIVATLPHELNGLIKKNFKLLAAALFRAAAETIKDWMFAKYGLKTGMVSVMHTFGEQKNYHPHVHMIVAWGGLGRGLSHSEAIKDTFASYAFLRKKFRIKFEDLLIGLYDKGALRRHGFTDRIELMKFIKGINRHSWTFHLEPPMKVAEQVVRYVGRYSKRFCLSERKITEVSDGHISFVYKDYRDRDKTTGKAKEKICRLHYMKFFPRLLQHVPPVGYQMVRYYGVYANSNSIDPACLAAKKELEASSTKETEKQVSPKKFCKHCKCQKVHWATVFDRRKPKERIGKFNIDKHPHTLVPMAAVA